MLLVHRSKVRQRRLWLQSSPRQRVQLMTRIPRLTDHIKSWDALKKTHRRTSQTSQEPTPDGEGAQRGRDTELHLCVAWAEIKSLLHPSSPAAQEREKNSGRLGLSKISRCVQQQQQWTTEEVGNSSCATSCSKLTDEVTDPSDAWSGESPTATSQTLKPADPWMDPCGNWRRPTVTAERES